MKKLFCVLLGLMVAVCFCISVSADATVLQLAQSAGCFTGNILMIDDFSGYADTDNYAGYFDEAVWNGSYYANADPHFGIEGEALWIVPTGASVTYWFPMRGMSKSGAALANTPADAIGALMGAEGYGFYLKNELGAPFYFIATCPIDTGDGNITVYQAGSSPNDNLIFGYDIEMDDILEISIRNDGVITIPTGFEGYLFVPFKELVAGGETLDNHLTDGNWAFFRLYQWCDAPTIGEDDTRVVIDNVFLYGDVPAFDTADILNGQIDNGGDHTPTPEPQGDPTPTPEPQQGDPTPTPDNGNQQGGQQGNDNPPSGAISLIGFAVAAVVAGAVIVRKKHD